MLEHLYCIKVSKTMCETTSPTLYRSIGIPHYPCYSPSPSPLLEAMRRGTKRFSHTTKNYIGQHYTTVEKEHHLFLSGEKEPHGNSAKGGLPLLLCLLDAHDAVCMSVTDHQRPKRMTLKFEGNAQSSTFLSVNLDSLIKLYRLCASQLNYWHCCKNISHSQTEKIPKKLWIV